MQQSPNSWLWLLGVTIIHSKNNSSRQHKFRRKAKHVLLCPWSLPIIKITLQYKQDNRRKRRFPGVPKVLYIPLYCVATVCHCHLWQQIPHVKICTQTYFLFKGRGAFQPPAFQWATTEWTVKLPTHLHSVQHLRTRQIGRVTWCWVWSFTIVSLGAELRFLPQMRHNIGSSEHSRKHIQPQISNIHTLGGSPTTLMLCPGSGEVYIPDIPALLSPKTWDREGKRSLRVWLWTQAQKSWIPARVKPNPGLGY